MTESELDALEQDLSDCTDEYEDGPSPETAQKALATIRELRRRLQIAVGALADLGDETDLSMTARSAQYKAMRIYNQIRLPEGHPTREEK